MISQSKSVSAPTALRMSLWLVAVCALWTMTGCSSTPASLRHLAGSGSADHGEAALAETLDRIALDPESAAGKAASNRFFELWDASKTSGSKRVGRWNVIFRSEWPIGYFDALLPAADYAVNGFEHRHVRGGLGIALIGCRKNTHREPIEKLYPPELITRPVTAVFTIGAGNSVTVSLKNSMRHAELAADFSAPMAQLVGKASELAKLGFGGLVGSRYAQQRGYGLFLLEPYDPQKIPVLFVHGLLSTPLAWANVTNEMWGDPEFRRRYQIWHFHYPTSAPFLYSAKMLRQRLTEARHQLDPRGIHPASAQLHVIGHSMGGLLTRTLITNSGDTIWNNVFRVSADELKATREDGEIVADILHWKARKDVRQVIFIAVPHRGSDMSRGIVGRIGDALTGLPKNFTGLYARIHRDNPTALQPVFRDALSHGTLTSIDTLSPRHPMLASMNALPFAPWVQTHSIIGNRGRKGSLTQSSDGVVPYLSSHIDEAKSELIVPADHGAYRDPGAVAEILRILKR